MLIYASCLFGQSLGEYNLESAFEMFCVKPKTLRLTADDQDGNLKPIYWFSLFRSEFSTLHY